MNNADFNQFIVAIGNISYGHTFVGPFDSYDDAVNWDDENNCSNGRVIGLQEVKPHESKKLLDKLISVADKKELRKLRKEFSETKDLESFVDRAEELDAKYSLPFGTILEKYIDG